MTTSDQFDYLMEQVVRARGALGEALGLVQDMRQAGLNMEDLTNALAGSVRALFEAEQARLVDSSQVGQSMDQLRVVLALMQDVSTPTPELEKAISTVARILAILFPVYKELPEVAPCETARHSVAPLPLVGGDKKEIVADERRSSPRVSLEVDIGLHSDSNFFAGFSMDLSSGGLFVATYDLPPMGTVVNLNFKLPGGPVLSLDGEVQWQREYNEAAPEMVPGVGVRFVGISDDQERLINQYMGSHQPIFYEES